MEKCIFVLKKTSRPKIRNGNTVSGIGHPCMPFFTHVILWFWLSLFPPTFIDASNNQHKMVHVPKICGLFSLSFVLSYSFFNIRWSILFFELFICSTMWPFFLVFFFALLCKFYSHIGDALFIIVHLLEQRPRRLQFRSLVLLHTHQVAFNVELDSPKNTLFWRRFTF